MENNGFQNWSGNYGTLDLPSLPNPFATDSDQSSTDINSNNSFIINDAPPKVFFPPKMPLKRELEYKKKKPILEHISTSNTSPHKLVLKPTTSHPLNHKITTSPITPPFFKKFHKDHELLLDVVSKRHSSPKTDVTDNEMAQQSNREKIKQVLKKRSVPSISINTNIKNDLLKDDEKKMVIVHEVKPSDTIAGVALLYGIEISILKKSNKLWANDSIHLRKFLYIPIDQCSIIDDEAKVVVQDDHISIKTKKSLFSDSIIRPTFSPISTASPSSPFTIYERELLFCTLPEHASYNNHDLSSQTSRASTSSMWSVASSSSSISSTSSNNSTSNYTKAEIQQLSADQLTFFPSKKRMISSNSLPTLNIPLTTPTISSPSPVSHLNRHKQHCNIPFPLQTITQDFTRNSIPNNANEKYCKKNVGPIKFGTDRRKYRSNILTDSIDTELLASFNNKKDPQLVSPTY